MFSSSDMVAVGYCRLRQLEKDSMQDDRTKQLNKIIDEQIARGQ